MESQTPFQLELSKENEDSNLITPENNMNNDKINQIENLSIKLSSFFYFLMLIIPVSLFYIGISWVFGISSIIFSSCIALFYIFLYLYIVKFKIEIKRSNNIIDVNVKNVFGCNKIKLNGNTHFYCEEPTDDETTLTSFFIINNSNFDLDSDNIKYKPARLFYILDSVNFNKFCNIEKKFEVNNSENPFFFDITKYTSKKNNSLEEKVQLSNKSFIKKFGEHFFTLYLDFPSNIQTFNYEYYLYIVSFFNILPYIFCLMTYFNSNKKEFISFLPLIIFPIIIWILMYSCNKCSAHDSRIDFIFSKDFKRIFIGIVNYKLNGYSNTFEYHMDQIERFTVQSEGNDFSNLNVILKNKKTDLIKRIKSIKSCDQEGLEYILNGKINN